jgi:hypothetical protein
MERLVLVRKEGDIILDGNKSVKDRLGKATSVATWEEATWQAEKAEVTVTWQIDNKAITVVNFATNVNEGTAVVLLSPPEGPLLRLVPLVSAYIVAMVDEWVI